jgi:hypothetical protein
MNQGNRDRDYEQLTRRLARLTNKANAGRGSLSEADRHDLTATSLCLQACRRNAARLEAARALN